MNSDDQQRINELERLQSECNKIQQKLLLEIGDNCGSDELIRTLAKKVLPAEDVDGDSYGIPGTADVVEMVVDKLIAVTEERDRLKVLTNESNPVPDLRTFKWLDPECHKGCQSLKLKKAIKERENSYWKAYDAIHERNRTIEKLEQQLAAANERAEKAESRLRQIPKLREGPAQ